jgi:hypothetical protein
VIVTGMLNPTNPPRPSVDPIKGQQLASLDRTRDRTPSEQASPP